ncbi:MAG: NIPSNAP family protein [Halioglobus sp.]|nr:NIPSNAP family protein [Halioglobus sp.]
MIYELRRYGIAENRMVDMEERFREVTLPLFKKYGIELVGCLHTTRHVQVCGDQVNEVPTGKSQFVFMMSFADAHSRQAAWEGYHADADFLAARQEQAEIIESMDIEVFEVVPSAD